MQATTTWDKAMKKRPPASASYRRQVRSAIYGLWNGQIDLYSYVDSMISTIDAGLRQAYYAGAAECGILPNELTVEEERYVQGMINGEISYIISLAQDITVGSKLEGGKLTPLIGRAEMWTARYDQVANEARVRACQDGKLEWVIGAAEQHCRDCRALDGKVKRASVWLASGIRPQAAPNPYLECEGWRCACQLVPTSKPMTPGPLPGRKF